MDVVEGIVDLEQRVKSKIEDPYWTRGYYCRNHKRNKSLSARPQKLIWAESNCPDRIRVLSGFVFS